MEWTNIDWAKVGQFCSGAWKNFAGLFDDFESGQIVAACAVAGVLIALARWRSNAKSKPSVHPRTLSEEAVRAALSMNGYKAISETIDRRGAGLCVDLALRESHSLAAGVVDDLEKERARADAFKRGSGESYPGEMEDVRADHEKIAKKSGEMNERIDDLVLEVASRYTEEQMNERIVDRLQSGLAGARVTLDKLIRERDEAKDLYAHVISLTSPVDLAKDFFESMGGHYDPSNPSDQLALQWFAQKMPGGDHPALTGDPEALARGLYSALFKPAGKNANREFSPEHPLEMSIVKWMAAHTQPAGESPGEVTMGVDMASGPGRSVPMIDGIHVVDCSPYTPPQAPEPVDLVALAKATAKIMWEGGDRKLREDEPGGKDGWIRYMTRMVLAALRKAHGAGRPTVDISQMSNQLYCDLLIRDVDDDKKVDRVLEIDMALRKAMAAGGGTVDYLSAAEWKQKHDDLATPRPVESGDVDFEAVANEEMSRAWPSWLGARDSTTLKALTLCVKRGYELAAGSRAVGGPVGIREFKKLLNDYENTPTNVGESSDDQLHRMLTEAGFLRRAPAVEGVNFASEAEHLRAWCHAHPVELNSRRGAEVIEDILRKAAASSGASDLYEGKTAEHWFHEHEAKEADYSRMCGLRDGALLEAEKWEKAHGGVIALGEGLEEERDEAVRAKEEAHAELVRRKNPTVTEQGRSTAEGFRYDIANEKTANRIQGKLEKAEARVRELEGGGNLWDVVSKLPGFAESKYRAWAEFISEDVHTRLKELATLKAEHPCFGMDWQDLLQMIRDLPGVDKSLDSWHDALTEISERLTNEAQQAGRIEELEKSQRECSQEAVALLHYMDTILGVCPDNLTDGLKHMAERVKAKEEPQPGWAYIFRMMNESFDCEGLALRMATGDGIRGTIERAFAELKAAQVQRLKDAYNREECYWWVTIGDYDPAPMMYRAADHHVRNTHGIWQVAHPEYVVFGDKVKPTTPPEKKKLVSLPPNR